MKLSKLIPGEYYTVISGRFEGVTGVAVEPDAPHGVTHAISSPELPDEGVISFLHSFDKLRKAKQVEELRIRRAE